MSDKEFWLIVRRALLMMVYAIEKRYGVAKTVILEKAENVTVAGT